MYSDQVRVCTSIIPRYVVWYDEAEYWYFHFIDEMIASLCFCYFLSAICNPFPSATVRHTRHQVALHLISVVGSLSIRASPEWVW